MVVMRYYEVISFSPHIISIFKFLDLTLFAAWQLKCKLGGSIAFNKLQEKYAVCVQRLFQVLKSASEIHFRFTDIKLHEGF